MRGVLCFLTPLLARKIRRKENYLSQRQYEKIKKAQPLYKQSGDLWIVITLSYNGGRAT